MIEKNEDTDLNQVTLAMKMKQESDETVIEILEAKLSN